MAVPNIITMKLHRNKVLVSLQGYAVEFVADQPVAVPKEVVREALEIGAVIVNADQADVIERVVPDLPAQKVVSDPVERENMIREAIAVITSTNSREDFTGTGTPHAKAVTKLLAFTVQQKDVNEVWRKVCEEAVEE